MSGRHWTPAEDAQLRSWYADRRTAWIAEQVGRASRAVYQRARLLGLSKSRDVIIAQARANATKPGHGSERTRFAAGHRPWNTGINYEAGGRSAETRFPPGHKPHNWHPIGHERITDGYLQRKITDTGETRRDYVAVHHLVWIAQHGPIPRGYAVIFRDGNRRNFALDNLELVSRSDLMRRNSVHNLPKELAELCQLRGALNRQINARTPKETP